MRSPMSDGMFAVMHQAWNRVEAHRFGDSVTLRRLRGGAAESWWLDLSASGGVSTRGIAAECLITVLAGRVRCTLFGNEVDLLTGHFALLPPNTPFALRTGGRSPAQALAHFSAVLPEILPIEVR